MYESFRIATVGALKSKADSTVVGDVKLRNVVIERSASRRQLLGEPGFLVAQVSWVFRIGCGFGQGDEAKVGSYEYVVGQSMVARVSCGESL